MAVLERLDALGKDSIWLICPACLTPTLETRDREKLPKHLPCPRCIARRKSILWKSLDEQNASTQDLLELEMEYPREDISPSEGEQTLSSEVDAFVDEGLKKLASDRCIAEAELEDDHAPCVEESLGNQFLPSEEVPVLDLGDGTLI